MKALLITPENQSIEEVQITGREDIVRLVGYDTLESDEVGDQGDRLFFDEECFLRATPGRFQIGSLIPVSGQGVVVGMADDGVSLKDVSMDSDDLRSRLKFL